ncbi:MAG: class I tRNA ligase family protein, partial [Deltaproteobacteria bacterium]|nr:class I tRNA ligase family protein [Deltaproteobacteria bacterium]
ELDKWALYRLNLLTRRIRSAYDRYEFHTIYHSATNFCINDMSAVYLDILKDRLYCSAANEPLRKTAQSTIYIIVKSLLELLAPVLSFTADEAWQFLPGQKPESIHLASLPAENAAFDNQELAQKWAILLSVREKVLKQLEEARANKEIGNALEAAVTITAAPDLLKFLGKYAGQLADIFIVSDVSFAEKEGRPDTPLSEEAEAVDVTVAQAGGAKCQRCWKYFQPAADGQETCIRCSTAIKA